MKNIKTKINNPRDVGIIYEIEHTKWVPPIVVVPKRNEKFRVYVNIRNVNDATTRNHYPLTII